MTESGWVGTDAKTRTNYITACGYTLSATNANFGVLGGGGNVSVVTTTNLCPWSAISNDGWIQITGPAERDQRHRQRRRRIHGFAKYQQQFAE